MLAAPILWLCATALTALTVAAAGATLLRRMLADWRSGRRARERRSAAARLLAGEGAWEFHSPSAISTLLSLIALVQGAERQRMVDSALEGGAAPTLRRMLRGGSVRRRLLAAETMGYLPAPTVRRSLERASNDRDARVRAVAGAALQQIAAEEPGEP